MLSFHVFVSDIDYCNPRTVIFTIEGQILFGCGPHGTCVDGLLEYTCNCDRGWTGKRCETGKSTK